MFFSQLASITGGTILHSFRDLPVTNLITDSRKAVPAEGAIFFAITGKHHDGHRFLEKLYESGIRQFIVERAVPPIGADCNVLLVASSITALQQIVAHHRSTIKVPVIGITGSNGKTIVKEWLYQLLSPEFKIAKNPASYNSQLGVPLPVWQLQNHHTLGIFEAGISTVHEMDKLETILKPTIGVFTNIGSAHNEGFETTEQKVREKLLLFKESEVVIYCRDHTRIHDAIKSTGIPALHWGADRKSVV